MFFKRLVAVIPVGDERELWYSTLFGVRVVRERVGRDATVKVHGRTT
jgi:hypothetical protein